MLTDFDSPTAIDEHSYDNAQQSLSSLTDFSGWSLGLNEAEAGCGDNNSCSNDYDTMVIIGDPIDDGWGDWDWEWNLGDQWNEFMDDFWDDYWDNHFEGNGFVNLAHCQAQVSNVSTACYATAGTSASIGAGACITYAAALGPVGIGICGIGGIAAAGSAAMFCGVLVTEATNRCHQNYSASTGSGSSGGFNGSNSGGGSHSGNGGDYSGGGGSGGGFEWAIP